MKRLTGRAPDGTAYLYNMGGTNTAIDRLAAYEDTGLEPEEISIRRWIPVTERLPEPLVNVLALYGDGRMDIDWVDHEGCFLCENLYDGVTHWMPLPEPPEEVTNDA